MNKKDVMNKNVAYVFYKIVFYSTSVHAQRLAGAAMRMHAELLGL